MVQMKWVLYYQYSKVWLVTEIWSAMVNRTHNSSIVIKCTPMFSDISNQQQIKSPVQQQWNN